MGQPALDEAVNTVASFLAFEQVRDLQQLLDRQPSAAAERTDGRQNAPPPTDVIVLCASAVLSTAETVFSAFARYAHSRGKIDADPHEAESLSSLIL